jgi:hypothetical protein
MIDNVDIPCATASCPRCDLLFSVTLDKSIFTDKEKYAIEWASNLFASMAEYMLPKDQVDIAKQQSVVLSNLLERF